jgi:signal transduction histidine kinase
MDENGHLYQYLSINHNITQRKEAEEKIIQSEKLLRKITSQVPGNTYMFEINPNGKTEVLFMNHGTDTLHPIIDDSIKHTDTLREVLHKNDSALFTAAMKEAYQTQQPISIQYQAIVNEQVKWQWLEAVPEIDVNGKVIWFGATSDITPLVDYIASIEQIIFDIAHVIRRPISTMMGMTKLIIDTDQSEEKIKEFSKNLYVISNEMDKFIRELNQVYSQKRKETKHNIDVSSLIDKRDSLFR